MDMNTLRKKALMRPAHLMNTPLHAALLAVGVVFLLTACGGSNKVPLYVQEEEIADLRVPEGLDQPPVRPNYEIPGYFLPELAASRDAGRPPIVQTSAEAEASMAQIRFGAKGLHLEVQADQASVAEELAYILDHEEVGLILQAVDVSDSRFEFFYRHDAYEVPRSGFGRLAIWRSPEIVDYTGDFMIDVVAIGEQRCRIELLDGDGQVVGMEQAEHILAMLREALG